MGALRPVVGQILSRARYAEDCLEECVTAGIEQYVIVGAGLDSFALRRPDLLDRLVVFELDHPNTQRAKRDRLGVLGRAIPDQLNFVPIDFEVEAIDAVLSRSSFSREKHAFFSWLGTVPYLSDNAVFSTLAAISDRRAVSSLRRFTARRGEPLLSFFEPAAICGHVRQFGYRVLENLAPTEQNRRYFSGRSDGLSTLSGSYYLRLSVAG
jgi:O-methyltransferase involved in polyketide biosynthesis